MTLPVKIEFLLLLAEHAKTCNQEPIVPRRIHLDVSDANLSLFKFDFILDNDVEKLKSFSTSLSKMKSCD